MRFLAHSIAIVILVNAGVAHTEGLPINQFPSAVPPLVESPEQLERTGRAERLAGIIVTSVGIAAAAFGLFSFGVAAEANPNSDAGIGGRVYGILGMGVAAAHLGVGIPLWIDGIRKIEAAGRLRLAHAPEGSIGAGVSMSF